MSEGSILCAMRAIRMFDVIEMSREEKVTQDRLSIPFFFGLPTGWN
jgi:hypothetical protein